MIQCLRRFFAHYVIHKPCMAYLITKGICLEIRWRWVSRRLTPELKTWIEEASRVRVNWQKYFPKH